MPTYNGTSGSDVITGDQSGIADDLIEGLGGDDTLAGGGGSNQILGGDGNDLIYSDSGSDSVSGGTGSDTVHIGFYNAGGFVLGGHYDGGDGFDKLIFDNVHLGSLAVDFVNFEAVQGTVLGSAASDILDLRSISQVYNNNALVFWAYDGNDSLYGSSEKDYAHGGDGDDNLYGWGNDDVLWGDGGNDHLNGGIGADVIYGGTGDDTIDGDGDINAVVNVSQDDLLYGNSGSDDINGYAGSDSIWGGQGFDVLDGGTGNDTFYLTGTDEIDDINGGDNGPTSPLDPGDTVDLSGVTDPNFGVLINVQSETWRVSAYAASDSAWIRSFVGIETIIATNFADTIYVGVYGMTVSGMGGNDTIVGGDDKDIISGGDGADYLLGQLEDDTIDGGAGADNIYGGDGVDKVSGGADNDTLYGDAGNDSLAGGDGNDTMYGGEGNDKFSCDAGTDKAYGGSGNDYFVSIADSDVCEGGAGDDIFQIDSRMSGFTGAISGGDGMDTVDFVALDDDHGIVLDLSLNKFTSGNGTSGTISGFERIALGLLDDIVRGSSNDEVIEGYNGNDTIYGGLGNDEIHGGEGNDSLSADGMSATHGTDANWLYGEAGDDRLGASWGVDYLDGGAGIDTLICSGFGVTVDLGAMTCSGETLEGDTILGFENIQGSQGNDLLVGSDGVNAINGGDGVDTIRGMAGSDTLHGLTGNDIIEGGGGADILWGDGGHDQISGGAGNDSILIKSYSSWWDWNEDGIVDPGETEYSVDTLDDIDGGSGTDTLDLTAVAFDANHAGRFSIDLLAGTWACGIDSGTIASVERIHGSQDRDVIYGADVTETLWGGGGNDSLWGRGGNDNLFGELGSDILDGGAGNDILDGGAGNDVMRGGAGIDRYVVDTAGDGIVELVGEGYDIVSSFVDWTLADNCEVLYLRGSALEGFGNTLANKLFGTGLANTLHGGGGNDELSASGGNDTLLGDDGNDRLDGNGGADTLTGGAGADVFVFSSLGDSAATVARADRVVDFSHAQHDLIDLSALDANTAVIGDQAFAFIGTAAFSHTVGEIRYRFDGAGNTQLIVDVDGNGTGDFSVVLTGEIALQADDFVL